VVGVGAVAVWLVGAWFIITETTKFMVAEGLLVGVRFNETRLAEAKFVVAGGLLVGAWPTETRLVETKFIVVEV
jgi:hypothetical protein